MSGQAAVDPKQLLLFQRLHPVFSKILEDVHDGRVMAKRLSVAKDAINTEPAVRANLHLLMDYLLYPFSFLLESIVQTRKPSTSGPRASVAVPAMATALAAEMALDCFLAILTACTAQNAPQLVAMGSRLAELVHLPPQHAAVNEELMLLVLACYPAVYGTARTELLECCALEAKHARPWRVSLGYSMHGLLGILEQQLEKRTYGELRALCTGPSAILLACARLLHDIQAIGQSAFQVLTQ
jgi:hypothetical protein